MKLNRQIRIIVTSTDVKKIDLEIKKLKLLLEGKTLSKVTVLVKKKKQKFYTVLKSPQKYKRAKKTYCSYIYEAMLSTKLDLNSNSSLLLLSQLKDFYTQNTNIGFKIITKVVKTAKTNKSLHLSTKLQNRFLKNKKRYNSDLKNKKLDKISEKTPRQRINLFVKKFIKYIKRLKSKRLKNRVIKACILDSLKAKPKQVSRAKMLINKKLKKRLEKLKRKREMAKKRLEVKKLNKKFNKNNYKSQYKGKNNIDVVFNDKFQRNKTNNVKFFDNKTRPEKPTKSNKK